MLALGGRLTAADYPAWLAVVRARFAADRVAAGSVSARRAADVAERIVAGLLPDGPATADQHLWRLGRDGHLWLQVRDTAEAFLYDLRAAPGLVGDGLATAESAARERGARLLRVNVFATDTELDHATRAAGFQPVATQMRRPLTGPPPPAAVRLDPMSAAEFTHFDAAQRATYVADLTESGLVSPAEAAGRADADLTELLADGLKSPGQHLFTVRAPAEPPDRPVGSLWLMMLDDADERTAFVCDVRVAADRRRRGFGRAIMLAGHRWCQQRGLSSVGLSVFGFNRPARALYDDLGYRPTEELRVKAL